MIMIHHKCNTDIRTALNVYHLGYDTEYRSGYWCEHILYRILRIKHGHSRCMHGINMQASDICAALK